MNFPLKIYPVHKRLKALIKEGEEKVRLKYLKKLDIPETDDDTLLGILQSVAGKPRGYYSTPEYHAIWPYIEKIGKELKRRKKMNMEKEMEKAGISYGDSVYYGLMGPFLSFTRLEGIVQPGKDRPKVKITKGAAEIGKKIVKWHPGWKKL